MNVIGSGQIGPGFFIFKTMLRTPLEQKIEEIIKPVTKDMGLDLLCANVSGADGRQTVQILAENKQTNNLSIGECTELSRAVSALFDVEDPIKGAYSLEVSSPGIDRPLINAEDYERYQGFEAKVETSVPSEIGQKRFRGHIEAVEGDRVTLKTDQGLAEIDINNVKKAKLVLSDELIKATSKNRKEED